LGAKPKTVIADAGYGGEGNYAYLENKRTAAVIKYGICQKEESRKRRTDCFKTDNWEYNKEGKYYVCPNGKKLAFRGVKKTANASGHAMTVRRYECESCKYCRLQKRCKKGAGNRGIERNERRLRLKRKAKGILGDEQYRELRERRSVEVETVFGQIKGNQGYRRFLPRGMTKVSTEWALLAMGYNLKQIYRLNREETA
jgi:hypothetical protein